MSGTILIVVIKITHMNNLGGHVTHGFKLFSPPSLGPMCCYRTPQSLEPIVEEALHLIQLGSREEHTGKGKGKSQPKATP